MRTHPPPPTSQKGPPDGMVGMAVFTLEDEKLVKTGFSSDEFLVQCEFVLNFNEFPVHSGSFLVYIGE